MITKHSGEKSTFDKTLRIEGLDNQQYCETLLDGLDAIHQGIKESILFLLISNFYKLYF